MNRLWLLKWNEGHGFSEFQHRCADSPRIGIAKGMLERTREALHVAHVCLFNLGLGPGTKRAEAATKSKIAALEQLWNQAYKTGDTTALVSIPDDATVLVNEDGSVQTKAELLLA
jgi:hypothetical protein